MAKELVTGVVGIGNPLIAYDGIGPMLLDSLEKLDPVQNTNYRYGGTGGMNVRHILRDLDQALIIDCADIGLDTGEYRIPPHPIYLSF